MNIQAIITVLGGVGGLMFFLKTGFRYLPEQQVWNPGIISMYEFYTSADGNNWALAASGEFANIKSNPQ